MRYTHLAARYALAEHLYRLAQSRLSDGTARSRRRYAVARAHLAAVEGDVLRALRRYRRPMRKCPTKKASPSQPGLSRPVGKLKAASSSRISDTMSSASTMVASLLSPLTTKT